MKNKPNETKVIILGGLGEVGRNMYCVMHEDELVIIDAGTRFPGVEDLGINYILSDYTFLKENESKIKALFITHGHEDHIGGIPFLIQSVNIPAIYAPNQAKELIAMKLKDRNIRYDNLIVYDEDTIVKYKHIKLQFFRTTHSIPDSHGIVIDTVNGRTVTTGDFKFDMTPIGPMADLHKIAKFGKEGVDLLISDSTNALSEGVSTSEAEVDNALNEIFNQNKNNRIIIATFASNIYRLKHIVDTCYEHGRKVCVFGRSMENNLKISLKGNYISHENILISPEEIKNYKPGEIAILSTGSQGEPLAALSRIAKGTHRQIKLRSDDIVIFSSSAIPGNALAIGRIINKLYLKGVKVLTSKSLSDIHTSGHANQEELKLMIRLLMPKYLLPFHGDYRMLKAHANLGVECGMPKENTFILENGDTLSMINHHIEKSTPVPAGDVFVEGNKLEEVNGAVLRDRKIMSKDGILVIIANIDMKNKQLLIKPNVTTRGFVLINENEKLIKEIEKVASDSINSKLKEKTVNFNDIKNQLINDIFPFVSNTTGRRPIILPVILDIKKP